MRGRGYTTVSIDVTVKGKRLSIVIDTWSPYIAYAVLVERLSLLSERIVDIEAWLIANRGIKSLASQFDPADPRYAKRNSHRNERREALVVEHTLRRHSSKFGDPDPLDMSLNWLRSTDPTSSRSAAVQHAVGEASVTTRTTRARQLKDVDDKEQRPFASAADRAALIPARFDSGRLGALHDLDLTRNALDNDALRTLCVQTCDHFAEVKIDSMDLGGGEAGGKAEEEEEPAVVVQQTQVYEAG